MKEKGKLFRTSNFSDILYLLVLRKPKIQKGSTTHLPVLVVEVVGPGVEIDVGGIMTGIGGSIY